MGFTSADFSVDAFKTFIGISAFFSKNKDPLWSMSWSITEAAAKYMGI